VGVSIIINEDKNDLRRYLLGLLGEADEERLELRLLTDEGFVEEFDTVVDEITDQYVGNELGADERKRVEQYFLTSRERQQKVQFADELMERAAAERSVQNPAPAPGFFERLRAFWTNQPVFFRTATTMATIVIAVGLVFVLYPRQNPSGTYTAVNLQMSAGDRSTGSEVKPVRLDSAAGIRIDLALPEQWRDAKSYRVELQDEKERLRDLPITERTPQSLVVTIPANEITQGGYIIRLYADGQRVRGSYHFNVE